MKTTVSDETAVRSLNFFRHGFQNGDLFPRVLDIQVIDLCIQGSSDDLTGVGGCAGSHNYHVGALKSGLQTACIRCICKSRAYPLPGEPGVHFSGKGLGFGERPSGQSQPGFGLLQQQLRQGAAGHAVAAQDKDIRIVH
jgi:hypothetical protein